MLTTEIKMPKTKKAKTETKERTRNFSQMIIYVPASLSNWKDLIKSTAKKMDNMATSTLIRDAVAFYFEKKLKIKIPKED